LKALRKITQLAAVHSDAKITVFLGGPFKPVNHAMNDVLNDSFADVRASLAQQESRVLVATRPQLGHGAVMTAYPQRAQHLDVAL